MCPDCGCFAWECRSRQRLPVAEQPFDFALEAGPVTPGNGQDHIARMEERS